MVSEFNIVRCLYKLEDFEEYHFPFENTKKNSTESQKEVSGSEESKKEESKISEIKKDEPEIVKDIKPEEELKVQEKIEDLTIKDEDNKKDKVVKEPMLLPGLINASIKFYIMSSDLSEVCSKPRFSKLFDAVVIGFFHGHNLKDKFPDILKDNARIYTELPINFVGIKEEYKKKCYEKIETMANTCGLAKILTPYDHHFLFRKR